MNVEEGTLLWTPPAARVARSHLTRYLNWLGERGHRFEDDDGLWRWSVADLEAFWSSVVEFCGMEFSKPATRVLGKRTMPGAEWFPGATLNYAQHALRHERAGEDALLHLSERRPLTTMSWPELARQVRVLATRMRALGIVPSDRVVAYLPNTPEAIIGMLASASIGAVWSSCGPDFGTRGVLDRYSQLAPKLLFCVDGYSYGGKPFDRRADIREIIGQLPTLSHVVHLRISTWTIARRSRRARCSGRTCSRVPIQAERRFDSSRYRLRIRCGSRFRRAPPGSRSPSSTDTGTIPALSRTPW